MGFYLEDVVKSKNSKSTLRNNELYLTPVKNHGSKVPPERIKISYDRGYKHGINGKYLTCTARNKDLAVAYEQGYWAGRKDKHTNYLQQAQEQEDKVLCNERR